MLHSFISRIRRMATAFAGTALLLAVPAAFADSISPISFSADLGVGESVTISKTVTVSAGGPTSALIDVVFLIDTSGSMGGAIAGAKAAAVDILNGLAAFGNLATGTGFYSEPGSDGLFRSLTTDTPTGLANINAITLGLGGGGGDFPEEGLNATKMAAEGSAWRAGSNRFIVALGDATFKASDGATEANTLAALTAADATFIGVDFANMTNVGFGGISPAGLAAGTGGSIVASSTGSGAIVSAILSAVSAAFGTYSVVDVDDLGGGAPYIDVTSVCTTVGGCTGSFDRSVEREFTFDVTFTRTAAGDHSFDTFALVDRGIVATERDTFGGAGVVPEPSTVALLGLSLLGLVAVRRRRH